MNRIYRVIWSQVKHGYVVVSEMANSRTKGGGSRVIKRTALAALVLTGLCFQGGDVSVYAADPLVINNSSGTANTVSGAENSTVIGDGNTVANSKSQVVIGDKNSVTDRNKGTVSENQDKRTDNVMDILIGKGNVLNGNDTYMNNSGSLTVIGNHNNLANPGSNILIGNYQRGGDLSESVIIGSMSADEQETAVQRSKSVVVGYHAQSGTDRQNVGLTVAVGYSAKALGMEENVVGHNSFSSEDSYWSNIYGADNNISTLKGSGQAMANSIVGLLNKVEESNTSMIVGSGNRITNAIGDPTSGLNSFQLGFAQRAFDILGYNSQHENGYMDYASQLMGDWATENGGSVFAVGNGNVSDYARLSQVLGSANSLNGTESAVSTYNTVAGYQNTGNNINHTAVIGNGNVVTKEDSSVVIGDYHELSGGSNNIILGSMATEDKTITKTYTPYRKPMNQPEWTGDTKTYELTVKSPLKTHKADLTNAVMIGYNTDVTENGGVALGAQSTASTAAGAVGYDPKGTDRTGDTTGTWKSTLAAVSVGDTANNLTRQITGVAAGMEATDAVNVAQLQEAVAASGSSSGLEENSNALSFKDNTLSLSIKDKAGTEVTGSVNLSTIASAIDTRNTLANADGDSTITIDSTEKNNIGGTNYKIKVNTDGKVESGSTGIVTGGTVYNETRVAEDGTYVKKSKSAGDNLTILDSQVASNTTQITTNTNNITNLSNQVTDISDSVTHLNGRVSSLDTRINRVGAGAAALAALHPQDYDPSAKWDFAAGYGNYKSANAVAIGAFYRPTNDVLFSIGTSMGGGENMFNAGVSFKFGSGNEYSNYSKASLAAVVSEQASTITSLNSRMEKQEQENQELRAQVEKQARENEALRTQVQEIARQLAQNK